MDAPGHGRPTPRLPRGARRRSFAARVLRRRLRRSLPALHRVHPDGYAHAGPDHHGDCGRGARLRRVGRRSGLRPRGFPLPLRLRGRRLGEGRGSRRVRRLPRARAIRDREDAAALRAHHRLHRRGASHRRSDQQRRRANRRAGSRARVFGVCNRRPRRERRRLDRRRRSGPDSGDRARAAHRRVGVHRRYPRG